MAGWHAAHFRRQLEAEKWQFEPYLDETARFLREALPALRGRASQHAVVLSVERSLGRVTLINGWSIADYLMDSAPLGLVLCEDETIRIADGRPPATVKKWRDPIPLNRPLRGKANEEFGSQEALLAFANAAAVSWKVREMLGEGQWHDLVLGELEPDGPGSAAFWVPE